MNRPWELHLDAAADPAYNMAKDAYLLQRAQAEGTASLRLYGWERLTLSVGRSQRVEREVDLAACRRAGVPLVRRITGGRAVLHGSDLTYAVAAPTALPPFDGGILPIYRTLSGVFVALLRELGCEPEVKAYTGRQRVALADPICFATPSAFEILVGGRKLLGSAQRLLPKAFLQHGSLPLAPQWALLARLFRHADARALRDQMTDLQTVGVLPAGGDDAAVREALVRAFGAVLGMDLRPAAWRAEDEAAVRALRADYAPEAPPSPVAARDGRNGSDHAPASRPE